MSRDDATEAQVRAADPALSTWLTANAGSGKTRVLTDRVARLLLGGTDPQKILCLTYTKAAASEMQNRLFRRLGNWAMLDENALRKQLAELGVGGFVDRDTLARARRLFARAIETPGGLKIQTIHSFCASLLRRFPIEARVSPDFTEMDDRAATLLRQDILEEMAAGEDVEAVDALADLNPGEDLAAVLAEICRNSAGFAGPVPDLASGATRESLLAQAFLGDETALMGALIPLLAASSTNDSKAATALADLSFAPPTMATLAGLEGVVLTKSGAAPFTAKIGRFPTKPLASGAALHLMPAIEALMLRVEAARPARLAIAATEKTAALHRFARAFLPRYEERKAAQGLLDFDDLIARSAALLADRSVAAWVLYRLDGGIDQILVDEAQDTSPGQWQVIERLAEEFTAGEGARSQDRRLFVVGDEKQSIYSFQGANLKAFREMRDIFAARHLALAAPFQDAALVHSFRSSTAILNVVDSAFDGPAGHGLGGPPRHLAFNVKLPGRVDLWQPIAVTEEPEAAEWDDPVDQLPARHHTIVLAEKIAGEIRAMIDSGVQIPMRDGERPVHEGDFLILVRRRSPLFHAIIRACKSAGLRIAGADRLRLGAELAVKDLTALLSFLATPEDDLSLAAVLRSPLFGWSEAALFDLAHRRPDRAFLWQALRDRASEFLPTMAVLEDLRDQADFLRPYELLERVLTRHDGRRKLLARLGPEAEDGLDAYLAEALSYETSGVPSLTGFLAWMQAGEVDVKRRLDSGGNAIRVMTVHGAKGLEAPVVILPDTAIRKKTDRSRIVRPDGASALWKTRAEESPPLLAQALADRAAAEQEESMRLLYVAMTRAETWLIVAAAGEVGAAGESWYSLVAEAMKRVGAAEAAPDGQNWPFGPGSRHAFGSWPAVAVRGATPVPAPAASLPEWLEQPAKLPPSLPKSLSPSALGGAKAIAGEYGQDEEAAKRRGTILHGLLEHLPAVNEDERHSLAIALHGENGGLSAETETLFQEATALLADDSLAHVFGHASLAEVELSARLPELGGRLLQGTVDRLIVTSSDVLAVDFKSNTTVPSRAEDVPDGILRQMGAYAAMLSQIYPDRVINTAILWTKTATLMPLPPNIVRQALLSTTLP